MGMGDGWGVELDGDGWVRMIQMRMNECRLSDGQYTKHKSLDL